MRQGAGPSRGGRGGEGEGEEGVVAATKTRRRDADLVRTSSVVTVVIVATDVATSRTRRGISSAREIVVQRFFPPRRADLAHPSNVVKCILSLSLSLSLFVTIPLSFLLSLSLSVSPFPLLCFFFFLHMYISLSLYFFLYFFLASFVPCIIPM